MAGRDPKATLQFYLDQARDAVLWKLEGLSEYDARRPRTPTATNLLGLVKHLASVELGYFGDVFERPSGIPLPWFADDAEPNADMWATAGEYRADVLDLYRRARAHADATIATLDLDTVGHVPHWPADRNPVTLHQVLVHMIAETHRHAGHADILREAADGSAGLRPDHDNLAEGDATWWTAHRAEVEETARAVDEGRPTATPRRPR